jgi:MFS family permease
VTRLLPSSKPTLVAPLRHRDFRLFWLGQLFSSIGSQFTTVAMAWQIYELTNSPLQIGLIGLVRAVPQIAMLLFGGLLADSMNRRRLMIGTQIGLFAVSGALAVITVSGRTSALTLYCVTGFLALLTSLEGPARHSLLANLVPRKDLARATALYSSQRYVAVIAGPAIAGLVLAFLGPAACYGIDALSWLVMLCSLVMIRVQLPAAAGWRNVSLNSLRIGWSFVLGHAVIFPLLLLDFGANVFGSARALLPIYARDILMVGPQGLGLLYAATAIGSLAGAVGFGLIGQVRHAGRWILIGVTVYAISVVLFAQSQILWISVVLLVVSGIGDTTSAVLRATINQLATPDRLRGSMASINSIFTNSGPQLGQFEAGAVAAWLGAEMSLLSGGLAILIIVALTAIGFPNIRKFTIPASSPATTGG